jgi:uncharacterized phage protein (TIGR02218 family)
MSQIIGQQNLKVSYQYIQWILQTNRGIMGHLYQFTSQAGENDYFTDLDIDISYGGFTWKSNSLRFEGLQRKVSIGVNVDQQTLKIWAAPTDTLFGSAFLEGAQQGLLDGAVIVRYRAVWPFVTGNAAQDVSATPIAVWPMFTGYTAAIDKGGASHVELKVESALNRLSVNMPRNYYQPGCLWTLFDSGCTLNQVSYAVTGTITAVLNATTLTVTPAPTGDGADGIANFAQGRLLFTSGVNNGFLTLIDNNDTTNLYLAYPLDDLPSVGDTITYYPGCSKSYNTCQAKFGNQANFRGFDKVPPIMVSI